MSTDYADLRAPWAKERPPLLRREPKSLAGVGQGLAVHLGGPAWAWRLGFVLTALIFGLGIVLYVICATAIPRAASGDVPVARSRLARRLAAPESRRILGGQLALAGVLGASAIVLFVWMVGGFGVGSSVVGILLVLAGAGVIWAAAADEGQPGPLQIAVGVAAVVLGAVLVVTGEQGLREFLPGMVAGLAVLIAVAIVVAPLWLRTRTHLNEEREARIREAERADIAAHLHDSVLQTLALIRSRADEADVVASLARSQERDLRRYLYSDRPEVGVSVAEALRTLAAEIEERYQHPIDIVLTGDSQVSEQTTALTAAVGEALTNACKHGGSGPISLYGELGGAHTQVWVRDRGPGFDPKDIADDRVGIKRSIIARIERVGGESEIRSPLPTGGSEVRISVPQAKEN